MSAGLFLQVHLRGYATSAKPEQIPMAIQFTCDQCAQPFFGVKLRFKVEEGTWPGKGIIRCHTNNTQFLECENGLKLSVAGVIFNTGGE